MAQVKLEFIKTYASEEAAVEAVLKNVPDVILQRNHFIVTPVVTEFGVRYGVAFLGQQAVKDGLEFLCYTVVG